MQAFHTYHHLSLKRAVSSPFVLFDFSVWLHIFGRSMIAIFIPILLLIMGYSIDALILYYLVSCILNIPLNFLSGWLVERFGGRIAVLLGNLSLIGYFIVLYNIGPNNWIALATLAVFAAFYDAFYWVAHFFLFMKYSKNKGDVSENLSIIQIVQQVAGIMAPALGALILIFFHKRILILTSVVIIVLSVMPLFKIKAIDDRPEKMPKKPKEFFSKKWDVKNFLSISLWSLNGVGENIMWPIFIFLLFETVQSVVLIPIIVSITTIVFTYFAGHIAKKDRTNMIALGSLLIALIWVARLLFVNNIFYYASIFLMGLFALIVSIPLDSRIFEKGEQDGMLAASVYRNTISMLARTILFAVLALLVNVFHISFVVAALSMFALMAISYVYKGTTKKKKPA